MRCVVLVLDAFLLRYTWPPESVESGYGSKSIAGDECRGRTDWRLGGILFVVSSPFFACLVDKIIPRCTMA